MKGTFLEVSIVKGNSIKASRRASTWLSALYLFSLLLMLFLRDSEKWFFFLFFQVIIFFIANLIAVIFEKEDAGLRDEGVVEFHSQGLKIKQDNLKFQEIKKIIIRTGRIQGEESHGIGIRRFIPKTSSGVNNYLYIESKQGTYKLRLRFTLWNSFEILQPWVELCYIYGISIDERSKEGKTYGLQERTFKEIQEFKESISRARKQLVDKNN